MKQNANSVDKQQRLGCKDVQTLSKSYILLDGQTNNQKMINRHSPFYIKALQSGKCFKSSNRNEVLLGHEEKVRNTSFDDNVGGAEGGSSPHGSYPHDGEPEDPQQISNQMQTAPQQSNVYAATPMTTINDSIHFK